MGPGEARELKDAGSPFQRKSLHVMFPDALQRAEERKAQRLSRQSSLVGVQLGPLPEESGSRVHGFTIKTSPPRKRKTYSKILTASVFPFRFTVGASVCHLTFSWGWEGKGPHGR